MSLAVCQSIRPRRSGLQVHTFCPQLNPAGRKRHSSCIRPPFVNGMICFMNQRGNLGFNQLTFYVKGRDAEKIVNIVKVKGPIKAGNADRKKTTKKKLRIFLFV